MPKTTPQGRFPFNKSQCTVTLYEKGNSPDYSFIYKQGVKAGRGASEGYTVRNNPKGDPINYIEVTGNPNSDIMKYNYMSIDFGNVGDGLKWYFIKGKTMLNYPEYDPQNNTHGEYAIGFSIELDVWETYKDKLGSPNIHLGQVTTNSPGGWKDTSMLEADIVPFSDEEHKATSGVYTNWKSVIGWQSKKPTEQDNYIIDGMRTTMQFSDNGNLDDYLAGLDDLASGTPEETNIWRSYITCNSYIVSEYFATENGGTSQTENINLPNPDSPQEHARLNYYPYKRAFIWTIDGQLVEINSRKCIGNRLPPTLNLTVKHSILPQPTSTLVYKYSEGLSEYVTFASYPTIDIAGRNITPTTQIISALSGGEDIPIELKPL